MNYALFCSVDDKRFDRGGNGMWVKLFATEEEAITWALSFLRVVLNPDELEGMEELADYHDSLGFTEYFHVYRVVE